MATNRTSECPVCKSAEHLFTAALCRHLHALVWHVRCTPDAYATRAAGSERQPGRLKTESRCRGMLPQGSLAFFL